jgi:hypothetical protein
MFLIKINFCHSQLKNAMLEVPVILRYVQHSTYVDLPMKTTEDIKGTVRPDRICIRGCYWIGLEKDINHQSYVFDFLLLILNI